MNPVNIIRLAAVSVLASVACELSGQTTTVGFDGSYNLTSATTPAGTYNSTNSVSKLGSWSVSFVDPASGSRPSITTSANGQTVSFSLETYGTLGGTTGSVSLSHVAAATGTFSFNLSMLRQANAFFGTSAFSEFDVYVNGSLRASYTQSALFSPFTADNQSFSVVSGQTIQFGAYTYANAGGPPFNSQGYAQLAVTLSNVSFPDVAPTPPGVVPEPAVSASLAGGAGLLLALFRRRRNAAARDDSQAAG